MISDREMPGQLFRRRNVQEIAAILAGPPTLVIGEPKGFVPPVVEFRNVYRAPGHKSGLVLAEFRFLLPLRSLEVSLASNASLRRNQKTDPCSSLVPVFVMMLIWFALKPYSAE